MNFQRLNIIMGWIIFAIASIVYLMTIEPTTSFWDTGEYIATAYKLEVGHPPGAPTFLLIARFFSMFVAPEKVAMMVNALSALCSSFTILFLFWTITAFGRKIALKTGELTSHRIYAVLGAGAVGALAYTFSDSFWFSAVEGEVYAMSSFFTAIVFWAMIKWESQADEPYALRWIVLIAFLIGLSIGVHLLNLLTIPALAFIYYFKKHEPTRKGMIITALVSIAALGFIQGGLIPGIVSLAAKFEIFFVNTLGLPFNSGTIFYFLLLIGGIIYGLNYTHKKAKPVYNTILLCFTMLLIGYSTFFTIIIRSQANPPIDENDPENAVNMLAYLKREQYGESPLVYGQYFNAPLDPRDPTDDGDPVYMKDEKAGKYIITDDRKGAEYNYDPAFCTVFPRMYSSTQSSHPPGYKMWADIKGKPIKAINNRGEQEVIYKPTFVENLRYFFRYQVGYMYFRYFLWNFSGRQNDVQGLTGDIKDGNWITGIPFIDSLFLGDQSELPESMKENKGRNKFFLLPLILGLAGMFYQFKKDSRDGLIVLLLFFFTGLAIVLYLNQPPYQPRERDYAYVGSFYAFAIWIGLGVMAIYDYLNKKLNPNLSAVLSISACLLLVPGIMAKEGWNDHDRSKRYTARDFAMNYLDSCAPNAILFTNGDNDTFPLWYVQEVEGYRTDVRVCNLSLLQTDWYISQMKKKAYESEPVPFSLTEDKYRQGTRDYVPFFDRKLPGYVSLKEVINFVGSDDSQKKLPGSSGKELNYFPTTKFSIPVDKEKLLQSGDEAKIKILGLAPTDLDSQNVGNIVSAVEFDLSGRSYVLKNDLMVLDLLANNNWERPIYFAITTGSDSYLKLEPYFQLEGLTYRLVPVKSNPDRGQIGRVNTEVMYDNLMNKFKWGGMDKSEIYMDENNLRMTTNLRSNFHRLADALIEEGKKDKARQVLDKAMEVMPEENVPYNFMMMYIAESYLKLGENEKGSDLLKRLTNIYTDEMRYYASLKENFAQTIPREIEQGMQVLRQMQYQAMMYKQEELSKEIETMIKSLPAGQSRTYNELAGKYFAGI